MGIVWYNVTIRMEVEVVTTITKISPLDTIRTSKLKVAAYCRVSTDSSDQALSLDAQTTHFTRYIKSRVEWEFSGLYVDEGISGTKLDKRDAFLRLVADCMNHKVDFIITKSISRFARNTVDCIETVRLLKYKGIFILFEKENINTGTSDSELMLTILSSFAAEESASISKNNKWGIKKRFENGTFKLSTPPFGYDWNGETLVPNEAEAPIVRRIFAEAIAGLGARAIAMGLNTDGVKTRKDKAWTETSIRAILVNEKYVGDVLHQKTFTDENYITHRNYGEEQQYLIENNHQPIISRADFDTVAVLLKQRGLEKGNNGADIKYQNRYTFTGRIICGECGGKFKRKICTKNKYIAWGCTTHINTNSRDCKMLAIKEESVKSAFVNMLNRLYADKILQPHIINLKQLDDGGRYAEIAKIEKQLQSILEQVKVLTGFMSNGYLDTALFNAKNNALQAEMAQLFMVKLKCNKYKS